MHSTVLRPCLPTSGKAVPGTPHWLHEVKHDGYRLIVARDGKRVRLFIRGGYDWADRLPWIVESAMRNRHTQFVIDGEAVILSADGVSDFDALHSRPEAEELIQTYWLGGLDHRDCPYRIEKAAA